MARYSVFGDDTGTGATTALYFVNDSGVPKRLKLYDLTIGSVATPADQAAEHIIRRLTDENMTPGGTAVTPFPLDQDEGAADSTAVESPTGEPTFDATTPATRGMLMVPINQRATFRWVAAPGSEFICSAAEDQGFAHFISTTTSTFAVTTTMLYEE